MVIKEPTRIETPSPASSVPASEAVATMAIGAAGAANAGLMAAGILAVSDAGIAARLDAWRAALSASIPDEPKDEGAE